jgi:hypothetical protein
VDERIVFYESYRHLINVIVLSDIVSADIQGRTDFLAQTEPSSSRTASDANLHPSPWLGRMSRCSSATGSSHSRWPVYDVYLSFHGGCTEEFGSLLTFEGRTKYNEATPAPILGSGPLCWSIFEGEERITRAFSEFCFAESNPPARRRKGKILIE